MQIKTTMRYCLTPVRITTIKNVINKKCWQGCGGKGTLVYCWWECKLMQPLWKTAWQFLKKLKIELLYDQQLHYWYIFKENKTSNSCTPIFLVALCIIQKIWKKPKCELHKKYVMCIHTHRYTHTNPHIYIHIMNY